MFAKELSISTIVAALCCVPLTSNAQEKFEMQSKASDQTFIFKGSDSTIVIVAPSVGGVFIQTPEGAHYDIPLADAADQAQPDVALRNQLLSEIQSASGDSTLDTYAVFEEMGPPPVVCDPALYVCEIQSSYAVASFSWGDPEPEKDPTDLEKVPVVGKRPSCGADWSQVNMFGRCYSQGSPYGYTNPEGSVSKWEFDQYKYEQFQKQQQAACTDMRDQAVVFGFALASTGVACKSSAIAVALSGGAATPAVGLWCSANVLNLAAQWYRLAVKEKQCAAAYAASGN